MTKEMNQTDSNETPYAVFCHAGCGKVCLSETEYLRQLSRPDSTWQCPRCGDSAGWDDEHHEKHGYGESGEGPKEGETRLTQSGLAQQYQDGRWVTMEQRE